VPGDDEVDEATGVVDNAFEFVIEFGADADAAIDT
jgi:hypothetical protein